MIDMTCKCGKTMMRFKHLKPSDFPKGWENDCCKTAKPESKPEPKPEPAPEKVVEPEPKPEPKRKKKRKKDQGE